MSKLYRARSRLYRHRSLQLSSHLVIQISFRDLQHSHAFAQLETKHNFVKFFVFQNLITLLQDIIIFSNLTNFHNFIDFFQGLNSDEILSEFRRILNILQKHERLQVLRIPGTKLLSQFLNNSESIY